MTLSLRLIVSTTLFIGCLATYCSQPTKKTVHIDIDKGMDLGHNETYFPHPTLKDVFLDSVAIKLEEDFYIPMTESIWKKNPDDQHMKDEDYVIAIIVNGQPYAFPWWIMKNHHIANIVIDSVYIVATLCEMCAGGSVYEIKDSMFFMQEGVYKGSWFMRDTFTDAYWLPFSGECFAGEDKGDFLTPIQTYQTTWKEWKSDNPNSFVLFDVQDKRSGHGSMELPGGNRIAKDFYKTLNPSSLKDKSPFDLVLGVTLDAVTHKAYPFKLLPVDQHFIIDSILDKKVLIMYKQGTTYGGAYQLTTTQNKNLNFRQINDLIIDVETKSTWNIKGECIDGPLKGHHLKPYFFVMKEKYGWMTYHPESLMYKKI